MADVVAKTIKTLLISFQKNKYKYAFIFILLFAYTMIPSQTASADMINGGLNSSSPISDAKNKCNDNTGGFKKVLNYYGIECSAFNRASKTTLKPSTNYWNSGSMSSSELNISWPSSVSWNRESYYTGGEFSVFVDGYTNGGRDQKLWWRHWMGWYINHQGDTNWPSRGQDVIKLINSNGKVYYIEISCANLISTEKPEGWSLKGYSYHNKKGTVNSSDAVNITTEFSPGDTVIFRHKIINNGPVTATYNYHILLSRNGSGGKFDHVDGSYEKAKDVYEGSYNPVGYGDELKPGTGTHTFKIPESANKGDKFCERIEYTDAKGPDTGNYNYNGISQPTCVTVVKPDTFKLVPTASIELDDDENPSNAIYGYCVKLTNDSSVSSKDASITVNLYVNDKVITVPSIVAKKNVGKSGYCLDNQSFSVTKYNLKIGDQVCIVSTVAPTSETNPGPTDSSKQCAPVVNKPVFRAFNGSVAAGQCGTSGGYLTSWFNSQKSPNTGAATNLATLSSGLTTGFASATGNSTIYGPNELTFAQGIIPVLPSIDSPTLGGNLGGSMPCLKDANSSVSQKEINSSSINLNDSLSDISDYKHTGNLTINSNVNYNGKASIFVDGDIYIKGNITYAGSDTWVNQDSIPRLIVQAKGNIYIDANVTQLDGVYIAKPKDSSGGGAIYTCSNGSSLYASGNLYSNCQKQLRVYGVFIANKINLLRTFGSLRDAVSIDKAAEQFYLSPEIYLNGTNLDSNSASINVLPYDAIYSLPPIL